MFPTALFPERLFAPRMFPRPIAVTVYASVLEAVVAGYLAAPAATALTTHGRLYNTRAPQGSALPYHTVFEVADATADRTTAGPGVRRAVYQINCYAATALQAKTAGEAVVQVFDRQRSLLGQITRNTVLNVECNSGLLAEAEGFGPDGGDCWVQTVDVEVTLSRF